MRTTLDRPTRGADGNRHLTDDVSFTLKKALDHTVLFQSIVLFILFLRNNVRHEERCSAADSLLGNVAHFGSGKSDFAL